ncbi:unnamed protein product [Heterobilharzia americana]|nr:unnamed protein product [Heterobilharzia americana]
MTTEYTKLESSIPSQPNSSTDMFTCDQQNSVIDTSVSCVYSNALFKNFPLTTTGYSMSLASTITTAPPPPPPSPPSLPSAPSATSFTIGQRLSKISVSPDETIQDARIKLHSQNPHPSEYESLSISLLFPPEQLITEVTPSRTTSLSTTTTLEMISSNNSIRSVTRKQIKNYQNVNGGSNKNCTGCNQPIIDKLYLGLSDGQLWHVNCLNCHMCGKCLNEEISCFNRCGKIYCREDYEQ